MNNNFVKDLEKTSGMDSLDYITASDSAMEIENQSDNSSSGSSLFKTQCVPYSPKRRPRNPIRKCVRSLESVQATDSSSDSSIEPRPLTLKAIFERLKKKKRKKRKKYKPTGRQRGRPKGRKNTRSQINKKQFKDKRPQLSFLESENGRKPLPWRKILTFEQAVARGFFNYLEKLKYEYHLKESLKQMNVGEDLEKDDLDSRRYKYLDDDGSLSPIEESAVLPYMSGLKRVCEIEKPGRSIYYDPNCGSKSKLHEEIGSQRYRWGIVEVCPYSSVAKRRSTERTVGLRSQTLEKLSRCVERFRTCGIP